jgi:hypothetical protein
LIELTLWWSHLLFVVRSFKLKQNLLSSSCRSPWSCLVLVIATLCASVPRTSFLLASFPLRYEAVPLRCTWCAGTTPFGGAGLDDSATSPSSVSRPCSSTTNLHILSTTCRPCNCLSLSLSLSLSLPLVSFHSLYHTLSSLPQALFADLVSFFSFFT